MMQVPVRWVWIFAGVMASLLLVIWGLTLYIYGADRHMDGYVLGCAAERARNPAIEYIESGVTFCYESGTFYHASRAGRGLYRVKR